MERDELAVERDRRPAGRQAEHERGVGVDGARDVGGERRARPARGVAKDADAHQRVQLTVRGQRARRRALRRARARRRRPPVRRSEAAPAHRGATSTSRRRSSSTSHGHDAEDAAGEHERESVAAHLEPRRHRRRGQRQLVGGALEDLRGDRIAAVARPLHDRPERRDGRARHARGRRRSRTQPGGVVHAEVREDVVGERRVAGRGRRPRAPTAASASRPIQ